MLQGIYTPDINTIAISSAVNDVYQSNPVDKAKTAGRTNVCVVSASVVSGTIEVAVGTWDGSNFTATQRIGYAADTAGNLNTDWIMKVIGNNDDDAIRIITTGTTAAFVRTQGLMVKVN